jgi:hypothetical protein
VNYGRAIGLTASPEQASVTTAPENPSDELRKAYEEGFRAGKEIIASEFLARSELNQPYVSRPPMISEVDVPARVVNGVMILAHRELVIPSISTDEKYYAAK